MAGERVPYSPVSTVAPQLQPTRPIFVNSPLAAFGGATAEARGLLGRTLDTAGNELGTRATALMQLDNEAQARQSAVDFSNKAAQAWETFREKQGSDAGPQAYKAYQDSLTNLREQYRQNLSPVAGNLYDAQSFSVMERLNLYGATHSGEQLDAYQKTTAKAVAESSADLATKNPTDDTAYQKALAQSDAAVANNLRGQSGVDIAQQQAIARSKITSDRIVGLADTNPLAARDMLNDPKIRDNLRGEDIGKLTKYVRSEINRNSGHTISQGLFDGSSMQLGSGVIPIERAMDAIKSNESSGNYDTVGVESTNSKGQTGRPLGAYGVMSYNLAPWLKLAGLPPMTNEQFLKDHDAQDTVFKKVFGDDMQKSGSANTAAEHWLGPGSGADALGTTHAEYLARFNKALAGSASSGELTIAARAHAAKLAPDDPDLPDIAASETETRYNQIQKDQKAQSLQVQNNIDQVLINQVGTGPMSLNALMQNDAFADAYRQLQPKDQLKVQAKILSMSKQDNVETDQRTANFNRYNGLAYVDPEAFKAADLTGTDLTANQRTQLQKLRNEAIEGKMPPQDPMLTGALRNGNITDMMRDVLPQTQSGGIDKNSKDYQEFVGAMQEEVMAARANGKTLSPEELEAKAKDLLTANTKAHWWSSTTYKYETPLHLIPADQQAKIRQAFKDDGRGEPSDAEIEHVWAKHMYNEVNSVKQNGR